MKYNMTRVKRIFDANLIYSPRWSQARKGITFEIILAPTSFVYSYSKMFLVIRCIFVVIWLRAHENFIDEISQFVNFDISILVFQLNPPIFCQFVSMNYGSWS